jgi:hypothetical protein
MSAYWQYVLKNRYCSLNHVQMQAQKSPRVMLTRKYRAIFHKINKYKVVLLQAWCGPECSRRFGLPDFHDIRHMKVVMSALGTVRLYSQECS